jgi:hypothetical protein
MLATAQITGSKAAMVEAIVKLRASAGAFKSIKEVRNELKVGDTSKIISQPMSLFVASVDEDGVGAMKVAELKVRLKSLGVKSSGTKPELQARLRGLVENSANGTLPVHGASPQPPTRSAAAGDSDTVKMSRGLQAECREDCRLATAQITGCKAAMVEAITGAAGPDALSAPRAATRAAPLEDGVGGGGRGVGGTGGGVGSDFHKNKKMISNKQIAIDLNKHILSSDTETLCAIIKTRAADFDHINVATALRKALEAPRHLVPKKIMDILEESALKNMETFGPQEIASSLHIAAKKRYRPQDGLFSAIEQRAEAISGEFNAQNVANTLWAYAKMGRKPGERLMGLLEGRAEAISREFNAQAVANTVWAYAKMGRKPGERLMILLEGRAEAISGEFNAQAVANTLWAYATMGRKPGERMMGRLEGRAEATSGEFNPQAVEQILLWYKNTGRQSPDWLQELTFN